MARRFRKDGEPKSLRVHNYADLPHSDSAQALTAELKILIQRRGFPKRAWVNFWDVASSHQYLLLPTARRSELEAAAKRHGASALGLHLSDVAVGASIGQPRGEPGHQSKTEVSFFAAPLQEIHSRLRPIVDAGFVVEGVTTPCGALWSQARLRRPAMPGDVHAFVALSAHMSSLAIFANGFLLYARDLNWGYAETPLGLLAPIDREELASRLSTELRRSFLYLKQYWEQDVSQLLLCGDMPEIRSLTAPLIERLNIEVETLDTLEGIDAAVLPEPAGRFSEQVAAFRLASAIAVEPTPVNLLPLDVTTALANRAGQRVFMAGSAAAVAVAAFLFAQADVYRESAQNQVAIAQRELSGVEPRVRAISVAQRTPAPSDMDAQERVALDALDQQGPRMTLVLDALSQAAPRGVIVTALKAIPDGQTWRVSIDARSDASDPALAQEAAENFLGALARSPVFGAPVRPATRNLLSGGTSVELTAEYAVSR